MLKLFLASVLVVPLAIMHSADGCYSSSSLTGVCTSNDGSQVTIGGTRSSEHSEPKADKKSQHGTVPDAKESEPCMGLCRPNYAVATVPDVTLADLASFVPARPTLRGEPAGLGVAGLPTNFIATSAEQLIPGTLLGFDVVVRFRPAGFVFDYGDGTTRTATSGGASWSRSFAPTATSHTYRLPGTYEASVTALYSASVDFGSGQWRPVTGAVRATTGGYTVRVVVVREALVDRTCAENPSGPGC